jgi:hypothetical protein
VALTVDFISDIVTSMTPTITIDSVVDNGDGTQTVTVCNTFWIRKYMTVTIASVEYQVSSFVANTSFTIPSGTLVTATSFVLQAPYYFHGSPMQVNNEHIAISDSANKYPLIYLVEALTDNVYDELDGKDKDMGLRIFFLDSLDSKNDEVTQHFTNVVKPLNASLDYFVEKLKGNAYTLPFSYDVTNRIKVGTYTTNQGNTAEIFSDSLDGVEFVSTLTVNKSTVCAC